jgi:hypothetical protein
MLNNRIVKMNSVCILCHNGAELNLYISDTVFVDEVAE